MRDHTYWVYILASGRNGTLYIGVTSDLPHRAWQHANGTIEGFTKRHNVKHLVYYEIFHDIETAIAREKTLKRWHRAWKIELIEKANPTWADLYDDKTSFIAEPPGAKFQ